MYKLTPDHYQKKAVLRCALFLPKEGPSLTKTVFLHAVPFQKTARELFDARLLLETERGVALSALVSTDGADRNDILFFYQRLSDQLYKEGLPMLEQPELDRMKPLERYMKVQSLLQSLEDCPDAEPTCSYTKRYLQAHCKDAHFIDGEMLKYLAEDLLLELRKREIKAYMETAGGAALCATLFNLLRFEGLKYADYNDDLLLLALFYDFNSSGSRAVRCAAHHMHLSQQFASKQDRFSERRFLARLLHNTPTGSSVRNYIQFLKKEGIT